VGEELMTDAPTAQRNLNASAGKKQTTINIAECNMITSRARMAFPESSQLPLE
jgi:hypothetical protein